MRGIAGSGISKELLLLVRQIGLEQTHLSLDCGQEELADKASMFMVWVFPCDLRVHAPPFAPFIRRYPMILLLGSPTHAFLRMLTWLSTWLCTVLPFAGRHGFGAHLSSFQKNPGSPKPLALS